MRCDVTFGGCERRPSSPAASARLLKIRSKMASIDRILSIDATAAASASASASASGSAQPAAPLSPRAAAIHAQVMARAARIRLLMGAAEAGAAGAGGAGAGAGAGGMGAYAQAHIGWAVRVPEEMHSLPSKFVYVCCAVLCCAVTCGDGMRRGEV